MTLSRLALSRSTLDRAAHRRTEPDLVDRLLHDPATVVLVLDGERAAVHDGAQPRLALVPPADALRLHDPAGATVAFLGNDAAGHAHVMVALPATAPPEGRLEGPAADPPTPEGTHWAGLRAVGHLLDDTDAGVMTCAVALANWHAIHGRCARCGAATRAVQAGWARGCPQCGAEHYPRTDPAVIMAIVDADDRILLGRQVRWPEKRFSTLAGFVEPGESLEAAVRREVKEEAGVVVGDVRYQGSQPWPFPSSLMLGFRGAARTTEIVVDGAELSQAQWWSREELALDVATGELLLPPRVSIARRLVEDWYGGPISDSTGTWR